MPAPPQRRRQRLLLQACAWVFIIAGCIWTALHLLMGNTGLIAWEAGASVPAGIAILLALRRQANGLALLLMSLTAWAVVVLLALHLDIPSPQVARGVHFYLLPICLAQRFLLQGRTAWLLQGVPLASLLLFAGLHLIGNPLGTVSPMGDAARLGGLVGTALLSLLLCALLLHLQRVELSERTGLPVELARAISQQQLQLYYQAQSDATGRLVGVEALLRWDHPKRGWILPPLLFDVAERSDLLRPLGDWVLAQALERLQIWSDLPGLSELRLAVNLSPAQLRDPELRAALLDAVAARPALAARLRFEFGEAALATSPEGVRDFLLRCRALGVATALDDFGSGFSSLAYLDELPVDQLKIDRSFVHALHEGEGERAAQLVQSVIALGRRLGLEVLAEGVQTEAQQQMLLQLGCRLFQGFLLAPPQSADDFEAWVHARRGGSA